MSFIKFYFVVFAIGWCATVAMADELTAAGKENLQAAHQGSIVVLKELWAKQREVPLLPVEITDAHGPQFLFSDKPEYFPGNGIALQEEVKPGVVRLYLYHVPEPTNGPKTISAVIENLGTQPMDFHFLHYAFPKPSGDYYLIGKTGLLDFFNSQPDAKHRSIPIGGRAVIDPKLDQTRAITDQLVHAFYEFEIDQPARVTAFQRDPAQSSVEVIDHLPKISRETMGDKTSGAGRGLFLTSDFNVTNKNGTPYNTATGPTRLLLADDRHTPAIRGHDSIDKLDSVADSGNYGVMYRIRIEWTSTDGRGLALLMTKIGSGQYCNAQSGAVQVNAGVWPGGTVAIPSGRTAYGAPGEMVLLQKFAPPPKGGKRVVEILYSPPGASCLPTPMLFVPY